MTVANGVENIHWLFTLGMIAMFAIMPIFGWITARYKTKQFMALCTLFFASCLVGFFVLFNVQDRPLWVTRTFYVWVNVFNMFIVSLFWSFMNDVYSRTQAKRLFAFIGAGGTAGAMSGPIITNFLVDSVGLSYLLLIAAGVLSCSLFCINWLIRWDNDDYNEDLTTKAHHVRNESLKGSAFDGLLLVAKSPYLLGICAFIGLYAGSIVFLTIQQAEIIAGLFPDPIERTKLFAKIDFAANLGALLLQLFITSHLIRWFGYRATLLIMPVGITLGFAVATIAPSLAAIVALQVFRRSGDYGIMKPTREMLFSVISRKEKYKAKNFIDTAILRTGDTASSWLYAGVKALGAAGATIPMICVALGSLWCAVAYWLGSQYNAKSQPVPLPIKENSEIESKVA